MFKLIMIALIISMGVEDKKVQKVYDKFLDLNADKSLHTDIDKLIADVRKAIEES